MNQQSNASARSTAEILAGLGATETTSPVLAALISPIVPITQQGVDEVLERFNDYLEEVNEDSDVIRCFLVKETTSSNEDSYGGRHFYKFSTHGFSTRSWAHNWNELLLGISMERYFSNRIFPANEDVTDELIEVLAKFIIDQSKQEHSELKR